MRKNTLATAVLAGITGVAGIVSVSNAVHINPDGTGQALIYPYYTTRDGNDTLISVVNTTEDAKALKVRFIEGVNSREVRDFNLYLSPFDVWTATITDDDDGAGSTDGAGARFITNDNSCTAPRFFDPSTGTSSGNLPDAEAFVDFQYTGVTGTQDSGPQNLDRTREGYVEIIEMGVLDPTQTVGFIRAGSPVTTTSPATAATHNAAGGSNVDADGNPLPSDCDAINKMWTGDAADTFPGGEWADFGPPDGSGGNIWTPDPNAGMLPPSGGLFGNGIVINVPGSRANGYDAVALDNFFVPQMSNGEFNPSVSLHTDPGSTAPSLAAVFPTQSDIVLQPGTASPVVVNDDWSGNPAPGPQAVTAALMTNQVMNEYLIDPALNAHTEWVVTHPTKRFHTFPLTSAVPPFTTVFPTPDVVPPPNGTACEQFQMRIWDRNEQPITQDDDEGVPPSPDPGGDEGDIPDLCFETNVVTFDPVSEASAQDYTPVLGSGLFVNFDPAAVGFKHGWAQLSFNASNPVTGDPLITHEMENASSGNVYRGLPAVGFAVEAASNASINALFGVAFDHAYSRVIE